MFACGNCGGLGGPGAGRPSRGPLSTISHAPRALNRLIGPAGARNPVVPAKDGRRGILVDRLRWGTVWKRISLRGRPSEGCQTPCTRARRSAVHGCRFGPEATDPRPACPRSEPHRGSLDRCAIRRCQCAKRRGLWPIRAVGRPIRALRMRCACAIATLPPYGTLVPAVPSPNFPRIFRCVTCVIEFLP